MSLAVESADRNTAKQNYHARYKARYPKLCWRVDLRNGNRFHRGFQLQILQSRCFAFIIEEYFCIINLPPILENKIWMPFSFKSDCSAEIRTNEICFCRKECMRNINNASSRLSGTSARFFNDDIAEFQLTLCERFA